MISRIAPTLGRMVLLLVLAACGSGGGGGNWVTPTPAAGGDGEKVHLIGVVRHHEVEGGFYAIHGSDGVTYDPTNLPAEFAKEGLEVEAEARRLDNAMGIHQVGTMVELARIRSRE
jgi:hypothetical protein